MELEIARPITLKCGITLPNRMAKAAMAERFGENDNLPGSKECMNAYGQWAKGGWGLVITGNVHVDRAHLGGPGDFAIDAAIPRERTLEHWKAWAKVSSENGTKAIVQICHPGRQAPFISSIAPSAIPLDLGAGVFPWLVRRLVYGTPKEMTLKQIQDVVKQFADAARISADAGFAGVEIHAAHGYLLSQFLSPTSNQRTDGYGGSALSRAKVVIDVVHAVRAAVPKNFIVGIKLNSADHQSLPDMSESITQLKAIANAGVDFLELSGGSIEDPKFSTGPPPEKKSSTRAREAFFIEFANAIRSEISGVPIMLTGGFRSRKGMEAAVTGGSCDLVGLARPAVINPTLPHDIILNEDVPDDEALAYAEKLEPWSIAKYTTMKAIGTGRETMWYTQQIRRIGSSLGSIVLEDSGCNSGSSATRQILRRLKMAKDYDRIYLASTSGNSENLRNMLRQTEPTQHTHKILSTDFNDLASIRATADLINKRVASGIVSRIHAVVLTPQHGSDIKTTPSSDESLRSSQDISAPQLLLVLLLLQSMDREQGRIVIVSSQKRGKKRSYSTCISRELSSRLAKDPKLSRISILKLDAAAPANKNIQDWFAWTLFSGMVSCIFTFFARLFKPNGSSNTSPAARKGVSSAVSEPEPETETESKQEVVRQWKDTVALAQIKEGDTVLEDWR